MQRYERWIHPQRCSATLSRRCQHHQRTNHQADAACCKSGAITQVRVAKKEFSTEYFGKPTLVIESSQHRIGIGIVWSIPHPMESSMKKIMIAALITGCASLNAFAADPATVNGKPIKQSIVDYIIKDATAQGTLIDDNTRANIIEKLITSELIDQEAKKSGIDKQPDFLIKEELSRRELRIKTYIEDYIKKNPIDNQAVQSEYDKFKAQLSDKEYKASHILVKTEDEAKDVISQLGKGADFGKIAKEKSIDSGTTANSGDLGWFQPESMVKPFSDAAVILQKGLYTSVPVQTDFGWHVIRLDDVRDTQPPPFDAVENEIRTNLQRQQLDQLVSSIRDKAKIVKNTETRHAK